MTRSATVSGPRASAGLPAGAARVRGETRSETLAEKLHRRIARTVVTRRVPLALDRAVVSFTFDDIAVSAAVAGAAVLEAGGARGSFYVCGALAGAAWDLYDLASLDQVAGLARRGHEIGCHTATHPNALRLDPAGYLRDVEDNARILEPVLDGRRLSTFAYPFGAIGLGHKLALQDRFRICRGIHGAMVERTADRGRLAATALEDAAIDEAGIDALIASASARRAWLVFYAHDVAPAPTRFGVTPGRLSYALAAARGRGCRIETVDRVLDRMGIR